MQVDMTRNDLNMLSTLLVGVIEGEDALELEATRLLNKLTVAILTVNIEGK